jgi:hypothetical protein
MSMQGNVLPVNGSGNRVGQESDADNDEKCIISKYCCANLKITMSYDLFLKPF